ncbi:16S rRNA (uracil(1498)-N(3))-methyltransferase [Hyphobacterium sp. SN044]|uniref:16S rRNA (uracil(1498)-N(3))-methyltransferase n=1 Tax=Hyphobacterium sp. SN044 TaxID=2912575 RepID=UPI001F0282B6|nr:16S rRNA (uracil(1498)-N(3))-methyltransferase [Hyphobacterium sp. SN044]MCF8880879.1 16S rRNA (uracil(1498)-N(3))-methyltransferase [Hyphobacterium sp. SN044]
MNIPRLYLDQPLSEGSEFRLGKDDTHYLVTVMRRGSGDPVRVFNARDGEWQAGVSEASRKAAVLTLGPQLRPAQSVPDLDLLFAPVKKARTDFIVEKATELGVRRIRPVMTRFTQAERVRTDRFQALAKEAAEQTERFDIPEVFEAEALDRVLDDWDESRVLIYCDEAGDDPDAPWGGDAGRAGPALEVFRALHPTPTLPSRGGSQDGVSLPPPSGEGRGGGLKAAILIGPEGGFSPEERDRLRSLPFVRAISLGPRILRADTAAVAALTLWQAMCGDWS